MTLDTKLILDALNKHFDQMDAKLDRWFGAQDARCGQRFTTCDGALLSKASELPTMVAAPAAAPSSTSPTAAATTTSCDTIFVSSSSKHATTHHIVAKDDTTSHTTARCSTRVPTPTPVPVTNMGALATPSAPPAPTSPNITSGTAMVASSASTTTSATTAASTATCLDVQPAASSVPLAPAAQGTKEEIRTNSPTKCSLKCLSCVSDVLKPMDLLTTICTAPLPSLHFTAGICREHLRTRYISTTNPSLSSVVALLCLSTEVHKAEKVLEGMPAQNSFLLEPLPTVVVDMRPWPPPTRCVMLSASVQLRPTPWPSFGCHQVSLKLEHLYSSVPSYSERNDMRGLFGNNWLHTLSYSVSADGFTVITHLQILFQCHTNGASKFIFSCGPLDIPTCYTSPNNWHIIDCSTKLVIQCGISDLMLYRPVFIFWSNVYWLFFTYHHGSVQWKLSWMSLMCINIHSGHVACRLTNQQPAVVILIGWPKLLFYAIFSNNFKMNQTIAHAVFPSIEPVTLWEIPWSSPPLLCFRTALLAMLPDVALKLLLEHLLLSAHGWLWGQCISIYILFLGLHMSSCPLPTEDLHTKRQIQRDNNLPLSTQWVHNNLPLSTQWVLLPPERTSVIAQFLHSILHGYRSSNVSLMMFLALRSWFQFRCCQLAFPSELLNSTSTASFPMNSCSVIQQPWGSNDCLILTGQAVPASVLLVYCELIKHHPEASSEGIKNMFLHSITSLQTPWDSG